MVDFDPKANPARVDTHVELDSLRVPDSQPGPNATTSVPVHHPKDSFTTKSQPRAADAGESRGEPAASVRAWLRDNRPQGPESDPRTQDPYSVAAAFLRMGDTAIEHILSGARAVVSGDQSVEEISMDELTRGMDGQDILATLGNRLIDREKEIT